MPGFRLGDHEFYDPTGSPAPLDRLDQPNRSPIKNAPPPTFLADYTINADPDGPSAVLLDGKHCGHGEPTFTVFDLAINGERDLYLAVPYHNEDEPTVKLKLATGDEPWKQLLALHEAFEFYHYQGQGEPPQPVADEAGNPIPLRAAICCEYPCDAQSVDDVSWIVIAVQYGPAKEHAIVFSEETA